MSDDSHTEQGGLDKPKVANPPGLTKSLPPVHDCESQGPDTEYQRSVNVETGKQSWICIWCQIAKKMKGEL